ncbi:MAG: glucose 1-dehydrogenase [Candidatus Doudnabacteria bacterium]|nr:glucose 1-dehydrogenase [bacterium]MDZ4243594.1 glucose 1-dehydrogenase [Candidatus Doudnabacteria bacterium]
MKQKTIAELFDLSGKTAVVTGGAMGIGYGIVKRLAEAGANIVIADMAEAEGMRRAKELKSAIFVKTDVSSESDVKRLISETTTKFGGLDIFVNNAGIYPPKPVLEMGLDLWEKIQAVNLRGVFLCSREAAKIMIEGGGGSIINIGSIDSLHPSMVGLAAYDASKHGVWGFTKNFALELAKNRIRVNAIAPGGISTEGVADMMKGAAKETLKEFEAKVPLGRFGQPDDIATVALFLASGASAYMTGSMVVVDGGVLLR